MNNGQSVLAVTGPDAAAAGPLEESTAVATAVEGPLVRLRALDGGDALPCPVDAVLAWVALSSEGAAEVARFAPALRIAAARETPVIDLSTVAEADRPLALARAKAAALTTALAAARCLTVELSRGLAGVRREHQSVLERYLKLESHLGATASAGLPVCDIAPLGDAVTIGPGSALGERASVLLPFNISGLCRLELAVVEATPDARLRVSVEGLEAAQELICWTRSGDALRPGWIGFRPPVALDEPPGSGRLWLLVEDGAVTLGCGAPHPLPDLRLVGDDAQTESPLALRAWTSVPGLATTEPPGAASA